MATGAAIVAGIGLTASVVGGVSAKRSQEEAVEAAENQAAEDAQKAQQEQAALQRQAAQDAKTASAETIDYGIEEKADDTYNDFLTFSQPKKTASIGGTSTSGLGFSNA